MFQFFVGCKNEELKLRWGIQYSHQFREKEPSLELVSAFIVGNIYKKISAVARVDRILKPSPRGNNISYIPFDPNSKATMLLGGFEFPVGNYFTFKPNIVSVLYDTNDTGHKPTNDLTYRLTIFFKI